MHVSAGTNHEGVPTAMITGIRLAGRGLVEETNLTFFTKPSHRISVVFGRNGSGKTTIGDGFARYSADGQFEQDDTAANDLESTLLIQGTRELDVPAQLKLSTLVFNERFIEDNVRISDDGIRALVLFGKAGTTEDELNKAVEDFEVARDNHEKQLVSCEHAEKAYETAANLVYDVLRKGWADRERVIKGNKSNSRVNQQTLDDFLTMPLPEKDLDLLRIELGEFTERLGRSRGGEEIARTVETDGLVKLSGKFNTEIFERTIEPPSGEGLANLVASALETHGSLVAKAASVFESSGLEHCPFCLQPVDDKHRTDLLEAIKNSVDRPAEEFISELDRATLVHLDIELDSKLANLDRTASEIIKHHIESINSEISRWNDKIVEKKSSLYSPIIVDFEPVHELVEKLVEELHGVEEKRKEWNNSIKSVAQLQSQTIILNKQVSRLEVDAQIENYREVGGEFESAKEKLRDDSEVVRKTNEKVNHLRSSLRREDIAADDINRGLATVFADPNRLKIVVADPSQSSGRFMLQSRGRYLKPHRLSVGERNVLSLCYFFTLFRQCVTDGLDLNKSLLVLDDPISSVDIDCRIGILSYLESQLAELLDESSKLKVLFLTHDVGIFHDLGKTSKAILESLKAPPQGTWDPAPWILRNVGTENAIRVSLADHSGGFGEPLHEYKSLLNFVYQYAVSDGISQENDIASIGIGNALRRVYEAFGVFIYGQKSITSRPVIDAYESLNRGPLRQPLRQALVTVLHGSSHNMDRMMMLGDFGMGGPVDALEKVAVVRRILALMHAVQPLHMRNYLPEGATVILEEWEDEYLLSADS